MTKDKIQYVFNNVYETYGTRVMCFLISYFRDKDIAEEAFQETFLTAYTNMDTLLNHPNPGGWLITTAKNKGRNIRDRKNRMTGVSLDETVASPSGEQFTENTSLMKIDDPVFTTEKYLPLRLKYAYGYTINEIANFYHIEESACKMRLKRAREHARKHFEEENKSTT